MNVTRKYWNTCDRRCINNFIFVFIFYDRCGLANFPSSSRTPRNKVSIVKGQLMEVNRREISILPSLSFFFRVTRRELTSKKIILHFRPTLGHSACFRRRLRCYFLRLFPSVFLSCLWKAGNLHANKQQGVWGTVTNPSRSSYRLLGSSKGGTSLRKRLCFEQSRSWFRVAANRS